MPTSLELMNQYRNLAVNVAVDDPVRRVCRVDTYAVQVRKYFMMNWTAGTEQMSDYNDVTSGSNNDTWFKQNKERIKTAAMGKGAPEDYRLALEWAVRARKIPSVNQVTLQTFSDNHLGIDCSGFVTNYLVAAGKRTYSSTLLRNTNAASYFNAGMAINDATQVRQGDLLVFMNGNVVMTSPGHIAVVESYRPQSMVGGNMRVVEATGANGANPKLLDSMYAVEQIIPAGGAVQSMILVVKRHGQSGSRVVVRRI